MEFTKKLIVKKGIGKTSGKAYSMLILDLGYRTINLSFDITVCAEALGVTPAELFTMENGDYVVFE